MRFRKGQRVTVLTSDRLGTVLVPGIVAHVTDQAVTTRTLNHGLVSYPLASARDYVGKAHQPAQHVETWERIEQEMAERL